MAEIRMSIDDIAFRLRYWKARHIALMAQYDALHALTGAMPDSALLAPVFDIWVAYTVSLSEIVGDKHERLSWYRDECLMGARPMDVHIDGKRFRVRTLRQLAQVIRG